MNYEVGEFCVTYSCHIVFLKDFSYVVSYGFIFYMVHVHMVFIWYTLALKFPLPKTLMFHSNLWSSFENTRSLVEQSFLRLAGLESHPGLPPL